MWGYLEEEKIDGEECEREKGGELVYEGRGKSGGVPRVFMENEIFSAKMFAVNYTTRRERIKINKITVFDSGVLGIIVRFINYFIKAIVCAIKG